MVESAVVYPDSNAENRNPVIRAGGGPLPWPKIWESVWPCILAGMVASGFCWLWLPRHPVPATIKDVFAVVPPVFTALFGFLLTSASILVGIKGSWYKQRAKEAGLYTLLVRYIFAAMWWCLSTAVLTVVARSYDLEWQLSWYRYGLSLWIFCAVAAIGSVIRALRIFSRLFIFIAGE